MLYVVAKKVLDDGELQQQDAASYSQSAAQELLDALAKGQNSFLGLRIDSIDVLAIAGRIAEGLKSGSYASAEFHQGTSRIPPDVWN